jgi:hypothetical protein
MYRQLYQMGGIGTLPMDYGQSLQVPQQPQPSFSSAQNITMNPLLNYGQPQIGQAGGTPLSMRSGGISRLGYQEGGMGMDQMMQSQMQDPMMQEQMQQAPEGIMSMMPQGASGGQQGQEGSQEQTALLTIIQLLIEQGVPPEQAEELAMQILQVFNQGGQPAVEEFANQLEQEEGMPENRIMMAGGGITGIYPRQGYFLKGVVKAISGAVKGVANAVKSVAKSPIGQIALAIAAPYAIGAMFPAFATLGGTGFMGAALRAGISNLAIQGITTGKFNPKQALIAGLAGGALSGITGPASAATNIDPSTGLPTSTITGTITQPTIGLGDTLQSSLGQNFQAPLTTPDITGTITKPSSFFSPTEYGSALSTPTPSYTGFESDISSMVGKGPNAAFTLDQATLDPAAGAGSKIYNPGAVQTTPNIFERGIASVQDFGTNLMSDPIGTIGRGVGATYDLAKKYPAEAILAATAAIGALTPQQPGEPDNTFQQRKTEHDNRVAEYITQYGGAAKVYSPGQFGLYAMEKAVDPFAGRSSYAANGGRIGYAEGSISFERQTLEKKGYGDMIRNMSESEILKLYDSVVGTFSRRFQAEGTMPMGEPRRNPAGIMELDYRAKGGFVPPVGIKEKADDIPAMLSNNEFVFTADAVRNAGGGNVNKGAERMYGLMKQLEAGGMV